MRWPLLFVIAVLLSGCAQLQREQQQAKQEEARQAFAQARAELTSAIAANEKINPIRRRITFDDPRQVSLQMLSSADYAIESEKIALEEWQALVTASFLQFRALLQQYQPWSTPLYDALRSSGLTLVSDLYSGKITYGQYNRQRLEISTKFQQAMQERQMEIQREAARMRQAQAMVDAQQSLAASAAFSSFSNYLQTQQLINQQMQPSRIAPFTCTRMGNTTSCF